MATKKKQVEETLSGNEIKSNASKVASEICKQILEHFGENSAEYAEAKAKAEKE